VKLGAKDNGNASAARSLGQDKFFAMRKKASERGHALRECKMGGIVPKANQLATFPLER
jgi:hypothetical protein